MCWKEATYQPTRMAFQPSGKVEGVNNLSVMAGEKRSVGRDGKDYKKQQKPYEAVPTRGYPQAYNYGGDGPTMATYPPSPSTKIDTAHPLTTTGHGSAVYPQRQESRSSYPPAGSSSGRVYPPRKISQSSKVEEPVTPPGYQPQQHDESPQYYPCPQASAPYNYQQAYYSKPPKKNRNKAVDWEW